MLGPDRYRSESALYVGGGYGTELRFYNPLDQKIEKISWTTYNGKQEAVNATIAPLLSFNKTFNGVLPPNEKSSLELWYRSTTDRECAEYYTDVEMAKLRKEEIIYDNCVVSFMPSKLVEEEFKLSVLRKCSRISKQPSFWDNLRFGD